MARALVLVGVARTGGRFPELPAVPGAVAAVRAWAAEQGVPDDLVLAFTDDDGTPVTASAVLAGVRGLVDRGDVDQLVVYFSGHGINTGNAEFWLLTGAPEDGSQAVNVSLTSWFAERLPVRHVVLVSDACRTAASTVQELSVQGVAVVPNLPPSGPAAAVDVFYACALGDPAYEVKDPAASGAAYQALFTSALVGALRGDHPALVTPGPGALTGGGAPGVPGGADAGTSGGAGPAAGFGLVQPWPLKRALPGLVAERLTAAHAPLDLAQTPDARLSSDPLEAWLSRIEPWPLAAPEAAAGDGAAGGAGTGGDGAPAAPAPASAAPPAGAPAARTTPAAPAAPAPAARVAAAEAADRLVLGLAVGLAAGADGLPAAAVGATAPPTADRPPGGPPSPAAPPGSPGAAPRPAVPAPARAPDLEVAPLPSAPRPGGPLVVVQGDRALDVVPVSPTAVVVTFASGGCAVLPTLPGRVTLATVERGCLVDCALPHAPGADGGPPPPGVDGAVARRALAAAWSRFGLRPDDEDDEDDEDDGPGRAGQDRARDRGARRAVAVDTDPLAALYRAWELHDRGRRAEIAGLAAPGSPGARLFDVVLLASGPDPGHDDEPVDWSDLLTPVPLLSRGWPLLAAAPPAVRDHALSFPARLPSHWTLFAAENAARVAEVAAATAPAPPEEEP
ncbi:caspase family protein [Cellulomonas sp. Y8]|uniref:caspase family protein n=1 Tax=Cellulomonas sp. Y8 TaxID=2591145 RepID=UPI001AEFFE2B|nr:caspase family protein [Cellulomonas sp. Y8]